MYKGIVTGPARRMQLPTHLPLRTVWRCRRRFLSTLPSPPQLFHLVFRFSFSFLSLFSCFHANCVSGLRSVDEDVHLLTNEKRKVAVLDPVNDLQNARVHAFGAVASE